MSGKYQRIGGLELFIGRARFVRCNATCLRRAVFECESLMLRRTESGWGRAVGKFATRHPTAIDSD